MIVMKFWRDLRRVRGGDRRVAEIVRRAPWPASRWWSCLGDGEDHEQAAGDRIETAVSGRREDALGIVERRCARFICAEAAGLGVDARDRGAFSRVGGVGERARRDGRADAARDGCDFDLMESESRASSSPRFFDNAGIAAVHVDSRQRDRDGSAGTCRPLLCFAESNAKLAATIPPLAREQVVVMGGFIGSTEDGVTTTLGRGGSDYTAAIVGAGIGAEEIQIWTDVDGMLTADPTILAGGYRVETCSFAEAAELAYFGAKVLHPATVLPAIEKNIPVRILNSRRPEVEGTLIVAEAPASTAPIRSIACKKNITLVNIVSTRMLMAHGFLRRIFEIFDRFETPVDMLATSEVSVSLTIDNTRALAAIREEIEEFAEISMEDGSGDCLPGGRKHSQNRRARRRGCSRL